MNLDAKASDLFVTTARCNTCGSSNFKVLYEAGRAQIHQIVQCDDCGLMYAYPRTRPISKDTIEGSQEPPLTAESRQVKHTADKLADYRRLADALERLLPRKGRLIEVDHFRAY
jgi:hypothetical protein